MYRAPYKGTDGARLEFEVDGELCLARIADANAEVEVEELRREERVDVVLVVERVEHFDFRNEGIALADADWPRSPLLKKEGHLRAPPSVDKHWEH